MNGINFEIDYDQKNGLLSITIHDAPEDWTYREEYGRLTLRVPIPVVDSPATGGSDE